MYIRKDFYYASGQLIAVCSNDSLLQYREGAGLEFDELVVVREDENVPNHILDRLTQM